MRHVSKNWHFNDLPFTAKGWSPQSQRCQIYIFTLIRKVQLWSHRSRRKKKEFLHTSKFEGTVLRKRCSVLYDKVLLNVPLTFPSQNLQSASNCSWKKHKWQVYSKTISFSMFICNSLIKNLNNQMFCFSLTKTPHIFHILACTSSDYTGFALGSPTMEAKCGNTWK